MATNKPFEYNINTAVRTGYRFLRSVYKGKPTILTAQDLNRHFHQIQRYQEKSSENIGPVLSNIKLESQINTHTISPNVGVNPMYVFYNGVRFDLGTTQYSFNASDIGSDTDRGVFLIAKKKTVLYGDDEQLSGIEIQSVPYQAESSETIVYVDERIEYGNKNTIELDVEEGEEIVCMIAYVSATSPMTTDTDLASIQDVEGNYQIKPAGINYEELDTVVSKRNGSLADYIRFVYDNLRLKLRTLYDHIESEVSKLDDKIDALTGDVDTAAGNTAFRNTDNEFQKYNFTTLTNTGVTVEETSVNINGNPNSAFCYVINNTNGSNLIQLTQGILEETRQGGDYDLHCIKLQDESILKPGLEISFIMPEDSVRDDYSIFVFSGSNSVTPNANTTGHLVRASVFGAGNHGNYTLLRFSKDSILRLVYNGTYWAVVDYTPNFKQEAGYLDFSNLWDTKTLTIPNFTSTGGTVVDAISKVYDFNAELLQDLQRVNEIEANNWYEFFDSSVTGKQRIPPNNPNGDATVDNSESIITRSVTNDYNHIPGRYQITIQGHYINNVPTSDRGYFGAQILLSVNGGAYNLKTEFVDESGAADAAAGFHSFHLTYTTKTDEIPKGQFANVRFRVNTGYSTTATTLYNTYTSIVRII